MNPAILNDIFRSSLGRNKEILGRVVLTSSVAGDIHLPEILQAVTAFNSFDKKNDPHNEHDFGSVIVDGDEYFFKIEYYALNGNEPDFTRGAENPMDSYRVMTIMRAKEY